MEKKMKKYISKSLILLTTIFCTVSGIAFAEDLEFSGDNDLVSTYIWRGVQQYNGFALQGTASGSYDFLSFGVWYSTVNFGEDSPLLETDPFIEVSLPTGSLETALGATIYTYDLFSTFNDTADYEYEFYGSLSYDAFELLAFYVPGQYSTKGDLQDASYWIELSAYVPAFGADWSGALAFGTYSSRFVPEPTKDAVGNFVLSGSKSVSELLTVGWNYSFALTSEMENYLWINLGIEY